jgi:hypothetical protein
MKKASGITTGITTKITRRKLGSALISISAVWSGALSSKAFAQTQVQTQAPADPLQAAKDRIKTAGDALAKEQVPMATEPSFQFKA